jgi:hypothetical protein
MTQDYPKPIAPPPELVQEWWEESNHRQYTGSEAEEYVVSMVAQWGADQELEACCALIEQKGFLPSSLIRAARRPKPPSLKEQALETLKYPKDLWSEAEVTTIRRALEQLDD